MQLSKIYCYKHSRILILAIISILVAGCGGGGSSSSGSNSGGDPSSTLLLSNASSGGISAVLEPQPLDDFSHNLLAQFTQFILPSAWASISVFLNGFSYGSADMNDTIMIAVTGGTYTLELVDDGSGKTCTKGIEVENDSIVTVTIIEITSEETCVVDKEETGIVINGGGNAPAGKTIACHKGKNISISPNALNAHTVHGDTPKPCDNASPVAVGDQISNDDDGGKPDKPDNPNKPVKA